MFLDIKVYSFAVTFYSGTLNLNRYSFKKDLTLHDGIDNDDDTKFMILLDKNKFFYKMN